MKALTTLALDIIIDPHNKPYLLEVQCGFGWSGLTKLYPQVGRELGNVLSSSIVDEVLRRGLREICNDKTSTYEVLSEFQPESFVLAAHNHQEFHSWLKQLECDTVLIKPPRLSRGKGIQVWERSTLLSKVRVKTPALAQEHIVTKLDLGSLRHIITVESVQTELLRMNHWPSYWRTSPGQVVCNISRGACPIEATRAEEQIVERFSEQVCDNLFKRAYKRGES